MSKKWVPSRFKWFWFYFWWGKQCGWLEKKWLIYFVTSSRWCNQLWQSLAEWLIYFVTSSKWCNQLWQSLAEWLIYFVTSSKWRNQLWQSLAEGCAGSLKEWLCSCSIFQLACCVHLAWDPCGAQRHSLPCWGRSTCYTGLPCTSMMQLLNICQLCC